MMRPRQPLADQCQRWQQGDSVLVESYLARCPMLRDSPQDLLDFIYHEVLLREDNGHEVHLEEDLKVLPRLGRRVTPAVRRPYRLGG